MHNLILVDAATASQADAPPPAVPEKQSPPPLLPRARRRLGRQHFAFYRAYLEGLDTPALAKLADNYLALGTDPRRVARTLDWLRIELRAAARRTGRRLLMHLLRLPPLQLVVDNTQPAAPALPSLEDFAAEVDPDGDFYREEELLELYQERYGAQQPEPSRQQRQALKRHKDRLAALAELEAAVAEAPLPEHAVDGWLDPSAAKHLQAVQVTTLGQLQAIIRAGGYRWYRNVPRLGEVSAQRIVTFLKENAATLGAPPARALAPLRRSEPEALAGDYGPRGALVPLEALRLPAEYDGSAGTNRQLATINQIGATNDLAAIHAWLKMQDSEDTRRSYRVAAERFLLWAILARGKPLSSLTAADCKDFMLFLVDPQPAEIWVSPQRAERWSHDWRPFAGPLAASSRATTYHILHGLMEWLTSMRYLSFNPFRGFKPTGDERDAKRPQRNWALSRALWDYVEDYLKALPHDLEGMRARFLFLLAYATGLRRGELARATTGMLQAIEDEDSLADAWVLEIVGKGKKTRLVPIQRKVIEAFSAYLVVRGQPADPSSCAEDTPLIASIGTAAGRPLTPAGINSIFKRLLAEAAKPLEAVNPRAAARLREASTHSLRHTFGTHALRAGTAPDQVQDNLGHASIAQLTAYNNDDLVKRIRAMEEFLNSGRK